MKRAVAVVLRAIAPAWVCSASALAIWFALADRGSAADSYSAAATLRQYEVEPTVDGVMGVLRQWRPSAENQAQIARLVRELGDDNWTVREAASRHLANMGTLAEAALRDAAEGSRDAEVVLRARKLLAKGRQDRAEELLRAALAWLRESPTPQATPLLLDLLPLLPDASQSAAREALWECAGPENVLRLREAIGDARPEVRNAAIPALERAAGAAAVPDLEPLLRDKSEATRLAAARALLDRRPRPSIAALLGLLDARQPGVCQQAAWLLQQVSGIPGDTEPLPDIPIAAARWSAWAAAENIVKPVARPRRLGLKRLQAGHYAQYPFVPGKLGNALAFDGTSNYIDLGNPSNRQLGIGEKATFEAWVRFDALPVDSPATIIGRNDGPGNLNKWVFAYAYRYAGVSNATVFHINSPSNGPIWLQSKPWTPAIGRWYHLAVVKRGNRYTFYRDGAADGTDSTTSPVPSVYYALLMGHSEQSFWLHGALDDVRMWNTDLTGDQIHARMNAELTGAEAGLVGYWTMNGSSGRAVADSARYGVNGTYKGRAGE